jgi:hypothetical protein
VPIPGLNKTGRCSASSYVDGVANPNWDLIDAAYDGLAANHQALRELIHFINDGPASGFASGAYKETIGTAFPTTITWYDKAGVGRKKLVEKQIVYTGVLPTLIVWRTYDTDEIVVGAVMDVITYSGAFETSRLRSIT